MNVQSITRSSPLSHVEVYYGDCRLVPAPLVDFSISPEFTDSGERTRNVTSLSLDGTVLILPSGSYEQMYVQQEALKDAFSIDYLDFTIRAGAGNKTLPSGTVICSGLKPKVTSIRIEPDIHVTSFDYIIELEDQSVTSTSSGILETLSDQWSFSENQDNCTLQITHNISATGPDGATDRFDQALRTVKGRTGIDKLPLTLPCFVEPNASGLFNLDHPSIATDGSTYEVSVQREETADVPGGSYSISEVFTIVSGVPFFYNTRTESFQQDQNGISTVSIQGTVQGLGRTLNPSFGSEGGMGFQRACSGFFEVIKPNLPFEASGVYVRYTGLASGLQIFSPTSFQISQNKCRGTIDFSVSYTDDPLLELPSGIANRSCSVQRTDGTRVFANHPIPFRRLGPIIQDIKTTTQGSVSIQCQVQAKNTGDKEADNARALQYAQDELNRLRAIHANSANFIELYVSSGPSKTLDDRALNVDASITYAFTIDLSSAQSANADIVL